MSDSLREQAIHNTILKIRSGSHLYGTNVPTSDEDYVGIFLPPKEYILGLKTVEEVDCGTQDKDENGKNTSNAIDFKLYEIRKFFRLALQNNPNILEVLFVDPKNIITETNIGQLLRSYRKEFLHKGLKDRFIGYAIAQRHKMVTKKDNFEELLGGYKLLEDFDDKFVLAEVVSWCEKYEVSSHYFHRKETGHHIYIGDICLEPGVYVKKAKAILKERLDKATNRSDLILKHGYDIKFGGHLIRLMHEGIELLETGDLQFPIRQADKIKSIRNGEWKLEEVMIYSDNLEDRMREAYEKTSLPSSPNYDRIENLLISIMETHLRFPM